MDALHILKPGNPDIIDKKYGMSIFQITKHLMSVRNKIMNIEFLETDNNDIACISCTHRYNKNASSYCAIDDHYMHYADMWTCTCDRHELAQRYYSGEYVKFNYTDDFNITHQKYGRIHKVVDNGLFVVFWNNDVDGYLYEKILNSQIISQERPSIEIPDDVFERMCAEEE